jgi:elongation factor 1-gamma
MSYFNAEVLPTLGKWFRPLQGRDPYNKKAVDDAEKASLKIVDVVEKHLLNNTYLAGDRVTLADLYAAGLISRGFQFFFDKKWRSENPNVTRWYETVYNQPIYSAVVDPLAFIDEPTLKNIPPKKTEAKKEAAPKAPKAAPKPKAKEVEDEEDDEPKEAPKPKHPLAALPKPTLELDEWKRQYSNNDTPDALKWFWANYKADEYSLWKIDYKYNEELTQVFMTSNLIGGFFARLEGSRKFIFGAASVYGQANDSVIKGAFLIRGQDSTPAFDVAPDFESYEFTKLDPSKPEDKEFVEDQWTWEKPVVEGGKTYPWADGKVKAANSPLSRDVTNSIATLRFSSRITLCWNILLVYCSSASLKLPRSRCTTRIVHRDANDYELQLNTFMKVVPYTVIMNIPICGLVGYHLSSFCLTRPSSLP